jgi:hypothetical protein
MPINLGDEIFQLLKSRNIFINDFHILSYILKKNLINFSLEFNSLDNQTFEKVLNFLEQNKDLCTCNISFFPEEQFFKTELLYENAFFSNLCFIMLSQKIILTTPIIIPVKQ